MRIHTTGRTCSLILVLHILTPYATTPKAAGSMTPATFSDTAKELLPTLVEILAVLIALSLPVLLILWRLRRPYS